ncbi:hypothetical protein [Aliikangiella coralliicola]|uniref:Uncharacterized protein n=1 Tax=Aliikangiella coralliicola TaxID=2592383 RepID=A0A545UIU2_9GAMM|nr:hypothetical protein [Aliikangiella coralliicola]TQV89385.1 hypothetical protein FLL46_00440 [Aliikangiella coralliicola]
MPSKPYLLNKRPQNGGEHEVHSLYECEHLPNIEFRIPLGSFQNCIEAVSAAKQKFPGHVIDGCKFCSPQCHTR